MKLKKDERIDDLCRNGYRIIQNGRRFCFGMDAVLLSDFASGGPGTEVLDMGTGTGVIPILMEARGKGARFTGLEIQQEMAEMAGRSVRLNGLDDRIEIVTGDLRQASQLFGKAVFNVVTCNPPYQKAGQGRCSQDEEIAVSRHEILCTLEDVIRESSEVLKRGGVLDLIHRPARLDEIIECMTRYRMKPARLRLVYPHLSDPANLVLVEGVKEGRGQLTVEKPLIVYDESGLYTEEIHHIYGEI